MTRLVDGLLEVARITENKFRLERRPLDVTEVLRRVTEDRAPQLAQHAVTLHTDLHGPAWVDGDEVRLTQVFANLLGNAIKFTPAGGTVWVEARREGEDVVVRVRDTGVGMEPETREHLFEPFRQGPQDLARSEGGLGLGLALAKGVVELHGGTIEAFSAGKGMGSEFVVRLAPCAQPIPEPAPIVAAVSAPRKVLVVEDNEDTANLLAHALEQAGHEVLVARTGPEALDLVRREHPAVVLCDLGLPEVSGYEVARAVRADPSLRDVFLVALTGYGRAEDARRSRDAGFDVHLTKPVDLDTIEGALAAWAG
jgi:two-component system CheB/CheR fusion protein